MSQIIEIVVEKKKYQIEWALSEYFGELKGKKFMLNKMAAEQIEIINNLSDTAKILLSAVAGAVIQHLIDNNCQINNIFEKGYFIVKNWFINNKDNTKSEVEKSTSFFVIKKEVVILKGNDITEKIGELNLKIAMANKELNEMEISYISNIEF